jgi:hypothetical protein
MSGLHTLDGAVVVAYFLFLLGLVWSVARPKQETDLRPALRDITVPLVRSGNGHREPEERLPCSRQLSPVLLRDCSC